MNPAGIFQASTSKSSGSCIKNKKELGDKILNQITSTKDILNQITSLKDTYNSQKIQEPKEKSATDSPSAEEINNSDKDLKSCLVLERFNCRVVIKKIPKELKKTERNLKKS